VSPSANIISLLSYLFLGSSPEEEKENKKIRNLFDNNFFIFVPFSFF